jgi:hypothetical protein
VDLLFDFTKDELADEAVMHGIILDTVTAQLPEIISKCHEIVEEDEYE